jgi:hypothetical protein
MHLRRLLAHMRRDHAVEHKLSRRVHIEGWTQVQTERKRHAVAAVSA